VGVPDFDKPLNFQGLVFFVCLKQAKLWLLVVMNI